MLHQEYTQGSEKFLSSPSECLTYSSISPAEGVKFTTPNNKKDKPRRNRSAFIIFSSEMRSKIKAEGNQMTNSNEMMIKLADLWKNLKADDKKKYSDMAEKEKVKYLLELNEFYQTHPFDVIQNKTKKNHVKKPCSAYGLFLREAKKAVKVEQPDLKMADVLKIVAERWKNLSEDQRVIYQRQAKIEKEDVLEKINQQTHNNADDQAIALPQKRLQSQKRVKKALIKENLKIQNMATDATKLEDEETSYSSPFEDAVFATIDEPKNNELVYNQNTFMDSDFFLSEIPCLSFNFNRMPSIEPIFQSFKEIKEEKPKQQPSTFPLELNDVKMKKSSDFLSDLLTFRSIQQSFEKKPSQRPSMIKQTSTTSTCQPNQTNKTSRQAFNDALMSSIDFEPFSGYDFDFLVSAPSYCN